MADDRQKISRVNRTKDQARISYDRLSPWYDLIAGWAERKYHLAGVAMLQVREGERVLEIGFGTGQGLLPLAQAVGVQGRVYGIDISKGMKAVASARLTKADYLGRVDLTCADAIELPYEADFFDAIFISFTLELFDTPEIPILLQECSRVLRVGGRLQVVAMAKQDSPGLVERLYEWFHRKWPRYADCRPIYASRYITSAGFKIRESISMSMWGLSVEVVLGAK